MAGVGRRPRLLFLCQTLPFPPDGGVWIRTYHVLRILSQGFDITALCFERSGRAGRDGQIDLETSRAALRKFADVDVFALPQRRCTLRFGWDHIRSLLLGRVYTRYVYDSASFRRRLRMLLASERFDVVHMDSLDLARYLPACCGVPVAVVHHDLESGLLRRRAEVEPNRWTRAYLRYQSRLMADVERYWCPRVDLNVVVSDHDRMALQHHAPGARVAVVPNGVDVGAFSPDHDADDGSIAYVGGTSPFPNLDALILFCTQMLPHLRHMLPDVPVRWVGRATADEQTYYRERHRVELTGYVDDPAPLMQSARCHIVPLRIGGGTRLKILNAWALGKPVVSTRIGCEGLAAVDGTNLLVRDDPIAFAVAVAVVFQDAALRRRLGEQGRLTAQRTYSWDVIGNRMLKSYSKLLERRGRKDPDVVAPFGQRPRTV